MSKLHLTVRIPPDYNRQAWYDILSQIERNINKVDDAYLFASTSVTADYTVTINDSFLAVDATAGAVTVTLAPAAEFIGKRITIKKIDSSANAVTVSGSETIDGAATQVITVQYDAICVMSDGTESWIV